MSRGRARSLPTMTVISDASHGHDQAVECRRLIRFLQMTFMHDDARRHVQVRL